MNTETYNLAELAQTLFEESGDALFLFDPESEQMIDVNPMSQRLTGYVRSALLRMPVHYLFRSETPGGLQRLRAAYRRTGLFHSREGFYLRHEREGVWVPVNLTVTRLHAEPRTLGLITARDVSERREAEAALRKTEAELRQVLASVSDSIWSVQVFDGRWQSSYCSPVVERITGMPAEHFQGGMTAKLSVVHPDDREAVRAALERLVQGAREREELEYRVRRPDGAVRWVRDSILARPPSNKGVMRLDGIITDVTDRKREEELLRARRSVLEMIARGAPLTEVLDRLAFVIEEQAPGANVMLRLLNRQQRRLYVAAAPSLDAGMLADVESSPRGAEDWTGESLRGLGLRHGYAGCRSLPIHCAGGDASGPPAGLLTLFTPSAGAEGPHDRHLLELATNMAAIAVERHQAEHVIRSSEARYRSLIENLEQCIFLKDAEYRFVAVNPPFCRALGVSESDVLGRTDFDYYPRDLAEKYRNDDRAILEEGRRLEVEETSVLAGQRRIVRVVKTPVREKSGRISGVLGIFWDVTEQRTLEDQLRQAQKMEAVGQLAGGVAHDFNNLLTAILGNLSMMSNTLLLDGPAREMLHSAESAALRAANLTRQLLGFARRTLLRPEATSLNMLIDEVTSLLKRTIDPRITLEAQKDPALWPVLADSGHVNQVLMNLCLNARDAMPDGGSIVLRTENVRLDEEKVRLHSEARAGEFVLLSVSDTGVGMSEEVRRHIFEPFFTTKGPGKGTGLGLATVFGIVQQHQGWIDCESKPGRGTTFRIHLPRLAGPGERARESDHGLTDHPPPEGTETILFVDDETILRNLGRTILERVGYTVLLAEDGVNALEVYQRERERIDLVVLDLTMPRLSGKDTFRALRAIDPAVKVLFASGYSPEQLLGDDQEQSVGFVPKPYRPRELAAVVRKTLDASASLPGEQGYL